MSKFLLIGSVAAMLYGDFAWGMEDIDPWRSASSSESQEQQNSESTSFNSPRRSRSNSQTSLKSEVSAPTRDTKSENMIKDQNRFIKIGFSGVKGNVNTNRYQQYHYVLSDNALVGQVTPTTIETITRDDLRSWNDIAEIRYANDVSYDKLENPKVILYRNRDDSCYIILRIEGNKHGVFYGTNERNVDMGRDSFSVYEVSEDVGSFTDNVARLIYVDESGLYFVSAEENSVEKVIDSYQKEGKFKFKGSVIKVSAIDGTITLNGEPITKDNFFDNWILEEREVEREVSKERGRTVIEKVKETKTILSTKQPKSEEIIRNFYPPNGTYGGIYSGVGDTGLNTFTEIPKEGDYGRQINLTSKGWMNCFISKRISIEKSRSKSGAEKLVRNGKFSSVLSNYNDKRYSGGIYVDNKDGYTQKVRDAIASQVTARGGQTTYVSGGRQRPLDISNMVSQNQNLFKDPEFVRSLKPAFAELSKDYEHNKESEMWIPFEIVKNL